MILLSPCTTGKKCFDVSPKHFQRENNRKEACKKQLQNVTAAARINVSLRFPYQQQMEQQEEENWVSHETYPKRLIILHPLSSRNRALARARYQS
jgi:hypothetical protein